MLIPNLHKALAVSGNLAATSKQTQRNFKMKIDNPIIWNGELEDDCTARWNGLILRAEWMDEDNWWWAVSKDNNNQSEEIDSSNNYETNCIGGEKARKLAETVAINFIKNNGK
jgi:hypothetical protein